MKSLESLGSEKFQSLTEEQLNNVNAGGFFPKKGTSSLGWSSLRDGGTAHYASDWRTGWFSSDREFGDAYVSDLD